MSGKCISARKIYVQINCSGARRFVKLYKAHSDAVVHHKHLFGSGELLTAPASLFREATPEERIECMTHSL